MKWGIVGLDVSMSSVILNSVSGSEDRDFIGIVHEQSQSCKSPIKHYASVMELLQDVNAILILTKTVERSAVIRAAASLGKHILCEPPFASTFEEASELERYCSEQGVLLRPFLPLRFMPPVKNVKSLLTRGELGRLVAIKAMVRNAKPEPWAYNELESGGGVVLNGAFHTIDLVKWLVDDEFKSVYMESATRFSKSNVEDCASLTIDFRCGVVGTVVPSWSRPHMVPAQGDIEIELVGTHGVTIVKVFGQRLTLESDHKRVMESVFWGDHAVHEVFAEFESEAQEIGADWSENTEINVLELCLAAYRSGKLGQPIEFSKIN